MFKIGNVKIEGKAICAPMAGVSNRPFRNLMRKNGAALVYTEMTSNMGLKFNLERTLKHTSIGENEFPVAIQIFGGDTDDYVRAAKFFDKNSNADIIDINMGCPVPKVAIRSQAGSALLKTPEKVREIIREVVKAIDKPLTIKIRIGWDENDLTYLEIAKIAEEEGASAIAVHGRTRSQMYTGKANWKAIKEIKQLVSIPVIGNGDVNTPEDAKKMLEETNVDAVMIARASQSNPIIFKQINQFLENNKYDNNLTLKETLDLIKDFYMELILLKGKNTALKEIKGFSVNWLKNYKKVKQEKTYLTNASSHKEFLNALEKISKNHN